MYTRTAAGSSLSGEAAAAEGASGVGKSVLFETAKKEGAALGKPRRRSAEEDGRR
jgi:hypothetical protein